MGDDHLDDLLRYLDEARTVMLWKLDGLSEYDVRRPMTPTGSNLLGIVKHTASVELGYLGDCLGRPSGIPLPWLDDDAEPNADMYATADESVASVRNLYAAAAAHSERTLREVGLDAPAEVPWWRPETRRTTAHRLVVHVLAETNRHAGQCDIVREMVDGRVGARPGGSNLPAEGDEEWWDEYVEKVERAARGSAGRHPA